MVSNERKYTLHLINLNSEDAANVRVALKEYDGKALKKRKDFQKLKYSTPLESYYKLREINLIKNPEEYYFYELLYKIIKKATKKKQDPDFFKKTYKLLKNNGF